MRMDVWAQYLEWNPFESLPFGGTYLNVTSSYKVDSISGGYELQEVKAALDSIYFVFVTGIGNEINIHCN